MIIDKRKWLLIISLIATISFLITLYFGLLEPYEIPEYGSNISGQSTRPFGPLASRPRIPINNVFISSLLLIAAIVPMTYYFISRNLEQTLEKKFDVVTRLMKRNNSVSNSTPVKIDDKNIVLRFLNPGERKVAEKLIEGNGQVLQSEISRLEGMTKLRTHRAVRDLERKGIIKIENHGKTNRIILANNFKEIMFK